MFQLPFYWLMRARIWACTRRTIFYCEVLIQNSLTTLACWHRWTKKFCPLYAVSPKIIELHFVCIEKKKYRPWKGVRNEPYRWDHLQFKNYISQVHITWALAHDSGVRKRPNMCDVIYEWSEVCSLPNLEMLFWGCQHRSKLSLAIARRTLLDERSQILEQIQFNSYNV